MCMDINMYSVDSIEHEEHFGANLATDINMAFGHIRTMDPFIALSALVMRLTTSSDGYTCFSHQHGSLKQQTSGHY